jgi:hypothetical protein
MFLVIAGLVLETGGILVNWVADLAGIWDASRPYRNGDTGEVVLVEEDQVTEVA